VTTNPTLIAKSGRDIKVVISEICNIIKGDVSAEVYADDFEGMISEGNELFKIAENIVLKLPVTENGIKACKFFAKMGKKTNLTLCFSSVQALLAAKAGATYISPFIGRLEDAGLNGIGLIRDIKTVFMNYPNLKTKILAASIRNQNYIEESAKIGADAITMSGKLIREMYKHHLTEKGLEIFRTDAKKGFE
jgi:transaldolase